jgi:hypothetical protein
VLYTAAALKVLQQVRLATTQGTAEGACVGHAHDTLTAQQFHSLHPCMRYLTISGFSSVGLSEKQLQHWFSQYQVA